LIFRQNDWLLLKLKSEQLSCSPLLHLIFRQESLRLWSLGFRQILNSVPQPISIRPSQLLALSIVIIRSIHLIASPTFGSLRFGDSNSNCRNGSVWCFFVIEANQIVSGSNICWRWQFIQCWSDWDFGLDHSRDSILYPA
jgi:hypothetical protein